jgi:DivIVA domain-containing protein
MAQEPETERDSSGIAHAGKRKWGYDTAQVDAFLERAHSLYEGEYDSEGVQLTQREIQNVSFDMRKGGYLFEQVDAALDRLERAVVDKQTSWEIGRQGRVAWKARTEELFRQIAAHAERADRERFASGEGKKPSYDRKQVDRLVDRIVGKAADELQIADPPVAGDAKSGEVDAKTVARVVFTQRKGNRGYDERQVDYFLSSCVQLLSRLESYGRISQYDDEQPGSAQSAQDLAGAPDQGLAALGVTPLFASAQQGQQSETLSYAPVHAGEETESFDALNKAEQAIFTTSAAQEPAPSFAPGAIPAHGVHGHAASEAAGVDYAADSSSSGAERNEPESHSAALSREGTDSVADGAAHHDGSDGSAAAAAGTNGPASNAEGIDTAPAFSGSATGVAGTLQPAQPGSSQPGEVPVASDSPSRLAAAGNGDGYADSQDFNDSSDDAETADATLAALAHMAEVSQELPKVSASVPAPKVPSLQNFSVPHFAADPVPPSNQSDDDADKNGMFPKAGEDMDLDIPDLSFPSFDGDAADSNSADPRL